MELIKLVIHLSELNELLKLIKHIARESVTRTIKLLIR